MYAKFECVSFATILSRKNIIKSLNCTTLIWKILKKIYEDIAKDAEKLFGK